MFEHRGMSVSAELRPTQAAQREFLHSRIQSMQTEHATHPHLPGLPLVPQLLPGGLRAGAAYSLIGPASTLAIALLAEPSAQGAWCGVLGLPHLGYEAASRWGVDLSRLILVPEVGTQWMRVVAALTDILTVVVARPPAQVSSTEASRLNARLRAQGNTLLLLGEWPGSEATLHITPTHWSGIARGHGTLGDQEVEVTTVGRGRPQRSRVLFPRNNPRQTARAYPLRGVSDSLAGASRSAPRLRAL